MDIGDSKPSKPLSNELANPMAHLSIRQGYDHCKSELATEKIPGLGLCQCIV